MTRHKYKMRALIIIIISLGICSAYSQELLYMGWSLSSILNFEDTTENKYIDIDTSNIWQI